MEDVDDIRLTVSSGIHNDVPAICTALTSVESELESAIYVLGGVTRGSGHEGSGRALTALQQAMAEVGHAVKAVEASSQSAEQWINRI